uniref:Uncharacterized protein n=1 Tax=Fagus sylvatica TaxID=28930 RepID=A0A2N9IDB4_FAGSY
MISSYNTCPIGAQPMGSVSGFVDSGFYGGGFDWTGSGTGGADEGRTTVGAAGGASDETSGGGFETGESGERDSVGGGLV